MDRYQRVEKPRADTPIDENEIRITSQGRMRNYITYAMSLLQVPLIYFLFAFFFFSTFIKFLSLLLMGAIIGHWEVYVNRSL